MPSRDETNRATECMGFRKLFDNRKALKKHLKQAKHFVAMERKLKESYRPDRLPAVAARGGMEERGGMGVVSVDSLLPTFMCTRVNRIQDMTVRGSQTGRHQPSGSPGHSSRDSSAVFVVFVVVVVAGGDARISFSHFWGASNTEDLLFGGDRSIVITGLAGNIVRSPCVINSTCLQAIQWVDPGRK